MNENNFNINENSNDDGFDINSLIKNDSDDFVIGKGFNAEPPKEIDESARKQKRKSIIKTTVWIVSILAVAIALGVFIVNALFDFLGFGSSQSGKITVEIKQGASTAEIAETLHDEGVIKMPFLFRMYSKVKGYDGQYKYGLYDIDAENGYEAIANKLITEGEKAESVKVTIPEGTGINDYIKNVNGETVTVKGIATILEEKGVCKREDFLYALGEVEFNTQLLKNCNVGKTYYSLEGYLFPDTYEFYASEDSQKSAQRVVETLIKTMDSKITDSMYDRAKEMGYDMNEILTMASIIQMEAGTNTDYMADVAAVFYNRLDNVDTGGTLGSSPTLYYGDSFGKKDDGRYNTQADAEFSAIKGLPPGPLCSPGIDAIKAALYPTEGKDYLYFITDSDGNFYFHKTMAEQNNKIQELKNSGKWTYETY